MRGLAAVSPVHRIKAKTGIATAVMTKFPALSARGVDKSGLIPESAANNAPKTASSALRASVSGPRIDIHHRGVTYLG
jgi:hypothetical protein